jgi:hypothetical protein
MDTINYDVTNIIFKQLYAIDRLQLYKVFNEPRPTQFQLSSELLASKELRGKKGLLMRAITTGEYEPCVQIMVLLQKRLYIEHLKTRERYTRSDFKDYDEGQRVDRVLLQLRSLPK